MSVNRENITWPAADGTWNIGFWDFYDVAPEDGEDWDYEWDVEYHSDRFWWASSGHADPDAASEAYRQAGNPNPGGGFIIHDRAGNDWYGPDYCERLDGYLADYRAACRR